eukprot:m.74149 g.74149  ORF g.74149 m.74149 type:complete len:57 (+) comp8441_c2_seq1:629-799(+)
MCSSYLFLKKEGRVMAVGWRDYLFLFPSSVVKHTHPPIHSTPPPHPTTQLLYSQCG